MGQHKQHAQSKQHFQLACNLLKVNYKIKIFITGRFVYWEDLVLHSASNLVLQEDLLCSELSAFGDQNNLGSLVWPEKLLLFLGTFPFPACCQWEA